MANATIGAMVDDVLAIVTALLGALVAAVLPRANLVAESHAATARPATTA
jgi:hypothetical protein